MILRVLQSGRPNSSIKFFRCLHRPASCGKMYINYICTKISKAIGMLYKTRFLVPSKSLLLLHYSFASCHSLHPLELLLLFSLFLSYLYFFSFWSLFPFCPGPFEVLPAPIHAVVFPSFSCSFVPLLWLLLVPMQEDCCSWTLKTQYSKVLCSVQTMQTELKLQCLLGRLWPKGNRLQTSR